MIMANIILNTFGFHDENETLFANELNNDPNSTLDFESLHRSDTYDSQYKIIRECIQQIDCKLVYKLYDSQSYIFCRSFDRPYYMFLCSLISIVQIMLNECSNNLHKLKPVMVLVESLYSSAKDQLYESATRILWVSLTSNNLPLG